VVRGGGRLPAAELGQQVRDVAHDGVRGPAQDVPGQGLPFVLTQVHGRPGQHPDQLARHRVRLDLAIREDVLGPPLGDRDHRDPGGQGQPGHPGLGDHRPLVRVAGGGALRVDDHALAVGQGLLGDLQHVRRVGFSPAHRQLAEDAQERPDELHVERR
jgi:hypothetical protein